MKPSALLMFSKCLHVFKRNISNACIVFRHVLMGVLAEKMRRFLINRSEQLTKRISLYAFLSYLFETADLQSYCGYFLALCLAISNEMIILPLLMCCSNYISPVGLFYAIFRLTGFSSDAFDFSSSKTG